MTEYEKYLAHYGIKGQKWGVRRFQNEDGTLINPKGERRKKKEAESDTWSRDNPKYLSDDELNRRNSRMQKEAQYRQSIANRYDYDHPIRKEVRTAVKKIFIATAIATLAAFMTAKYKDRIDKGDKFIKSEIMKRKLNRTTKSLNVNINDISRYKIR